MKNALMRLYLLLSIILLSGYAQLYAHQDNTFAANTSNYDAESFASSLYSNATLASYTALHFEKQQESVEISQSENEEEELSLDKLPFCKKSIAANNGYLSSYYANAPGLSYESTIKRPPCGKPFHSLSSRQFILFRVIRI